MSGDPKLTPGVKVEARWLPFAASISEAAAQALSRYVTEDGVPLRSNLFPPPDDLEAWREALAVIDSLTARRGEATEIAAVAETIQIGGATVHVATPQTLASEAHAYVDIHGGALVAGGGELCKAGGRRMAELLGARVYAVDYRLPPDHHYPAGLDDCVSAYRGLLARYLAANIVVGGGSAGANLAAAMVLRARDEGLPMPAGLVLLSPELDLTESGDSFEVNFPADVVLGGRLMNANLFYAAGHDLAHPYLSPLFGDFSKGFPPTFLQAGTRDLFLSNAARMHRALRRAGTAAELHVFEGMAHMTPPGTPEADDLNGEVRRFVHGRWKREGGPQEE
jgi:acetyl esterase/lipase